MSLTITDIQRLFLLIKLTLECSLSLWATCDPFPAAPSSWNEICFVDAKDGQVWIKTVCEDPWNWWSGVWNGWILAQHLYPRVSMLCNQSPSKFWRLLDLDNRDQIDPNWLERSRACCTHKSWSHEIRPQVFHHRACVPEPRLDKPIKWIKRIRGKIQNLDHGWPSSSMRHDAPWHALGSQLCALHPGKPQRHKWMDMKGHRPVNPWTEGTERYFNFKLETKNADGNFEKPLALLKLFLKFETFRSSSTKGCWFVMISWIPTSDTSVSLDRVWHSCTGRWVSSRFAVCWSTSFQCSSRKSQQAAYKQSNMHKIVTR